MLSRFTKHVVEFLKKEDGPTAVEYAVMLALIIVVCLIAITALGTSANATFGNVGSAIGAVGVHDSGGLTRKPTGRTDLKSVPHRLSAGQGAWLKTPIWISSPVKFARAPCQLPICPPPPLTPAARPRVSTYQQKKQWFD